MNESHRASIEEAIRKSLMSGAQADVPALGKFLDYVAGNLKGSERELVARYISQDPDLARELAKLKRAISQDSLDDVIHSDVDVAPQSLRVKARNQIRALEKQKSLKRQYRWIAVFYVLSLLFMALSLVFRAYFIQMVATSVIFAFKAIMDQRQTKTQILIYHLASDTAHAEAISRDLHSRQSHL